MFKWYFQLPHWFGQWLVFFGIAKKPRLLGCYEITNTWEYNKEVDMGEYNRTYHMYKYKLEDRYRTDVIYTEQVVPLNNNDCYLLTLD